MDDELLHRLNKWHEDDEYQKIVDELLAIPEAERDYSIISHLARALNNLGRYEEAVELLLTIAEEGTDDFLWHFRLGYAYFYLDRIQEAKAEFETALELDPQDDDVLNFIGWCKEKIQEEAGFKQENFDPELYTDEQFEAIERHIEKHIGHYERVFHEIVSPDIHIDVAIIEPTPERNYYTLVTMGMGAHRMSVPLSLEGENFDRAELLIALPPDWPINRDDDLWFWPVKWLKIMARLPGEQDTWLGWGHTVSNGEPFAENTKLSGMIVCDLTEFDEGADKCILPNGECVNFYQIIPLYREELEFKLSHSRDELLHLLNSIDTVLDINRPNYGLATYSKNFAIAQDDIKTLLYDWHEAQGCIATDRIMVDGAKVGYMYREEPMAEMPDSGWRFLAGDESDEYMENPDNSGVYSLNTICNYDPDIIPLLHAPYGTSFHRDENGKFVKARFEPGDP